VRAVVLTGEREVSIETVSDAELEASTDALLRITSTAIWGTDLHFYDGGCAPSPG
jgi:glutathione-independent formaldehyde dehydrogenase